MLDLREDLRPISAYVRDRERLLEEMFRCVKGQKLRAMLPDILKVYFLHPPHHTHTICLSVFFTFSIVQSITLIKIEKLLSPLITHKHAQLTTS